MSLLVIQIPARPRHVAAGRDVNVNEHPEHTHEYLYVLSPDGLSITTQGQAVADLLPKAESVVAVMSETDLSWHLVSLPKAPPAKMRQALVGMLEDALLDDPEITHFALPPDAIAGEQVWIAAMNRPWLRNHLAWLQKAEVFVDRVVPSAWPDEAGIGHFFEDYASAPTTQGEYRVLLSWSHAGGASVLALQGQWGKYLLQQPTAQNARWTASPGAAAEAQAWLGAPVNVVPEAQRLLQAARTLWNFRQFELTRKNRGLRALRDLWRQFMSSHWRMVRHGLIALVVVQLVGINIWAAYLHSQWKSKEHTLRTLVKLTFPRASGTDLQRDPLATMEREVQNLRVQAGKPGEDDFETLTGAAAAAWPTDRPAVDRLKFQVGQLSLSALGWSESQIQNFIAQSSPLGYSAASQDGYLILTSKSIASSRAQEGGGK
jgi:general secretion pathway protein L